MSLTYGSVCSGIEAATVAWEPLGWKPAWFAEIEPFPSAVLKHRWPSTPNLGDFTKIGAEHGPVDLLVGGTPCQSFSVAGKRAGLDDPRGNLTLEYLALARRLRPRWVVWENVPGVLSDDGGRTFGTILRLLGECGYGWAYRILDAQFAGVPQRRRRVFVIGHLGDWRAAAAVLFERHSLQGHPAPRREAGEGAAGTLGGGAGSRGWASDTERMTFIPEVGATLNGAGNRTGGDRPPGTQVDTAGVLIARLLTGHQQRQDATTETWNAIAIRTAQTSSNGHGIGEDGQAYTLDGAKGQAVLASTLRGDGFDASEDGTGRGTPLIAIQNTMIGREKGGPEGSGWRDDGAGFTQDTKGPQAIAQGMTVRRLTPRECERLQGFPDDYTLVPYRGKPAADGPRYKAIGNSMAVPVMRWIGERIAMVDAL